MKYNPLILLAPTTKERDENNRDEYSDSRASQEEQYRAFYGANVKTIPSFFTPFSKAQEAGMMAADLLLAPLSYLLGGIVVFGHGFAALVTNDQPLAGLGLMGIGLAAMTFSTIVDGWVLLALATRTAATGVEAVKTLFSDDSQSTDELENVAGVAVPTA